ncbi:MAG: efflux RND transporter periplasmic adaptor subunit [Chitinophagales bacterium]
MKKKIFIGLALMASIGALAYWYFAQNKKNKTIFLELARPQYGYISKSVTATGTIEPEDTVNVGTQISGTIRDVYVDFNSVVRKGQLLAELDKSLLQAQVNQFRANLAVAKNQAVYQESYFAREDTLFKTQVISKQEFETALYQYNAARAAVPSVQAQLDAAEKNLSYCDIYSPINGVVLTRNISTGQTVASSFNTPTLFIIARDITKMQVQASVDEADIGAVMPGELSVFTVDAFPEESFSGVVGQIRLQPIVSSNVVTYTTIIKAPNPEMKLKPGMTANIFIYTSEDSNALLIPAAALKFKPDQLLAAQYKLDTSHGSNRLASKTDTMKMKDDRMVIGSTRKAYPNARESGTMAAVWVKSGDTLVKKRIITGMIDDSHVQVLAGMSTKDEVVISSSSVVKNSNAPAVAKSPFMPTRRLTTPAPGAGRPNR